MENIFWVDMEMTGLDPNQAVIIEFAAIVTDLQFNRLAEYAQVVFQPPEALEGLDEWNMRTHTASGLLARVPLGKPLMTVEQETIALIDAHFSGGPAVLAGNSIHQDRKFIDAYMPALSKKLSYRLLDVSSFKQIFSHRYDISFPKENNHRALDDIQASINELKHYLQFVKIP